jgi:hypothetical protein
MENQDKDGTQSPQEVQPTPGLKKRPIGFSMLLIFASVFNGLLFLLMVAGLFYSDIVLNILQQYYKQVYISSGLAFMFILAGVVITGVSVFGLILLWQYRRKGIYFYIPAQTTMLVVLVVVLKSYDFINIAIAVVLMIIFGIYANDMNYGKSLVKPSKPNPS